MENKVELVGYYGGDEAIACSAWTSTSRELTPEKRDRIGSLIKQLWSADPVPHGTPFEKASVHFLVNTDIATHIQFLKHRISSFNGESARYKELKEDKYYLPEDWRGVKINEKAAEMTGVYNTNTEWIDVLEDYVRYGNELYHECLKDIEKALGRKRAKESARFFKTYNSQLQGDVMFNMRSFHNFLIQRTDSHAQLEIQEMAKEMLELVRNIEGNPFKYTLEAWNM